MMQNKYMNQLLPQMQMQQQQFMPQPGQQGPQMPQQTMSPGGIMGGPGTGNAPGAIRGNGIGYYPGNQTVPQQMPGSQTPISPPQMPGGGQLPGQSPPWDPNGGQIASGAVQQAGGMSSSGNAPGAIMGNGIGYFPGGSQPASGGLQAGSQPTTVGGMPQIPQMPQPQTAPATTVPQFNAQPAVKPSIPQGATSSAIPNQQSQALPSPARAVAPQQQQSSYSPGGAPVGPVWNPTASQKPNMMGRAPTAENQVQAQLDADARNRFLMNQGVSGTSSSIASAPAAAGSQTPAAAFSPLQRAQQTMGNIQQVASRGGLTLPQAFGDAMNVSQPVQTGRQRSSVENLRAAPAGYSGGRPGGRTTDNSQADQKTGPSAQESAQQRLQSLISSVANMPQGTYQSQVHDPQSPLNLLQRSGIGSTNAIDLAASGGRPVDYGWNQNPLTALLNDAKKKLDEANAANRERYQEAKGGYQDRINTGLDRDQADRSNLGQKYENRAQQIQGQYDQNLNRLFGQLDQRQNDLKQEGQRNQASNQEQYGNLARQLRGESRENQAGLEGRYKDRENRVVGRGQAEVDEAVSSRDRNLARTQSLGREDRKRISDQAKIERGKILNMMVKSGLANSTVLGSMFSGLMDRTNRANESLSESLDQRLLNTDAALTDRVLGAQRNLTGLDADISGQGLQFSERGDDRAINLGQAIGRERAQAQQRGQQFNQAMGERVSGDRAQAQERAGQFGAQLGSQLTGEGLSADERLSSRLAEGQDRRSKDLLDVIERRDDVGPNLAALMAAAEGIGQYGRGRAGATTPFSAQVRQQPQQPRQVPQQPRQPDRPVVIDNPPNTGGQPGQGGPVPAGPVPAGPSSPTGGGGSPGDIPTGAPITIRPPGADGLPQRGGVPSGGTSPYPYPVNGGGGLAGGITGSGAGLGIPTQTGPIFQGLGDLPGGGLGTGPVADANGSPTTGPGTASPNPGATRPTNRMPGEPIAQDADGNPIFASEEDRMAAINQVNAEIAMLMDDPSQAGRIAELQRKRSRIFSGTIQQGA